MDRKLNSEFNSAVSRAKPNTGHLLYREDTWLDVISKNVKIRIV